MKFYISVDWEGISGVVSWEIQDDIKSPSYMETRHRMTKEVNAAIEGLYEGGATYVLVNDSHGNMTNLLIDDLDSRAELIMGSPKPFSMVEGLTSDFNGALLLGYHPSAGTYHGIMDHTYSGSSIYKIRVNGEPFSEGDLNGSFAGSLGVPVILVSGDKSAVDSLMLRFKGSLGVISKVALGRNTARLYHPTKIYEELRKKAKEAAKNSTYLKPFCPDFPITIEIDYTTTQKTDIASILPEAERIGPRTIKIVSPEMQTAFRRMLVLIR
ncbi:MAG: D-aminopeptidase [candidate division WS2 bacterium]|nr:D-aminopeptidase [Candidatus Lithacetigena glycinireducens]